MEFTATSDQGMLLFCDINKIIEEPPILHDSEIAKDIQSKLKTILHHPTIQRYLSRSKDPSYANQKNSKPSDNVQKPLTAFPGYPRSIKTTQDPRRAG